MDNKRDKIIEQIRKLQDMQDVGSGAFQGEISNASALMQKLMDKYSISQMDVEELRNVEVEKEFESAKSDAIVFNILQWHWQLSRLVGRITHTRSFAGRRYSSDGLQRTSVFGSNKSFQPKTRNLAWSLAFFGNPTNVQIACELFDEWIVKIDVMAMQATAEYTAERNKIIKSLKKNGTSKSEILEMLDLTPFSSDPRIFRRSWLDGCFSAMSSKIYEQEKERDAETADAIVLYKAEIDRAYEDKSKNFNRVGTNGGNSFSSAGYNAGIQAGQNLEIKHTKKVSVNNRKLLKG